jgi:hypothetical protein
MTRPRLVIKPSPLATRLLLTSLDEELLRAALPPPTSTHPRAAPMVLEGLAQWLGRPLSVVLCADAQGTSSALGLCDGFGFGHRTMHYEVDVVDPRRRLRGLGPFRDLRRLQLRGAQ